MPSQQKSKKTKKRVGNAKKKALREKCWARGQDRKDARRDAQHAAEIRNRALKRAGDLTPWEVACAARRARRAAIYGGRPKTASNGKRALTRNG